MEYDELEDWARELASHPDYPRLYKMIQSIELKNVGYGRNGPAVLANAVRSGLEPPAITKRLTKRQREKLVESLHKHTAALSAVLGEIYEGGMPFPFQSNFDTLANDTATNYADSNDIAYRHDEDKMLARVHAHAYGYRLLMDDLPQIFDSLCDAGDWWRDEDHHLPKYLSRPNHPNSKRLYFLRRVTEIFVYAFGRPLREITLGLAGVYFDCSGLDEADVSKLAPVRKK